MNKQEILDLLQVYSNERYEGKKTKDPTTQLPRPIVTETSHLELDLGLDSLDRIEMWLDLEEKYHIDIPEQEVKEIVKVEDILKIVEKYQTRT